MEEETSKIGEVGYDQLYQRQLERQLKKDQTAFKKLTEILPVTPSVSQSYNYLASRLFM